MKLIHYPLSDIQRGILYHSQVSKEKSTYITQITILLREKINCKLLEEAWQRTIINHEILRAGIFEDAPLESQLEIQQESIISIPEVDFTSSSSKNQSSRVDQLLRKDRDTPLQLDKPPLSRFKLIKLKHTVFLFVWTHHHVLVGGESVARMIEESFAYYDSKKAGRKPKKKEAARYQLFVDYLAANEGKNFNYWKKYLSGFTNPSTLGLKVPSSYGIEEHEAIEAALSKSIYKKLVKFVEKENISIDTVIQGAWGVLVSRYAGLQDIVFGSVRGLPKSLCKQVTGLLLNTLPIRVHVNKEICVREYLRSLRTHQIAMRGLCHTSLLAIQKNCDLEKGLSLFDTVVDYKPLSLYAFGKTLGKKWKYRDIRYHTDSHYSLALEAFGEDGTLKLRLVYSKSQYSNSDMQKLAQYYLHILNEIIDKPTASIADVGCMTSYETKHVSKDNNAKERKDRKEVTVMQSFMRHVNERPNNAAINYQGQCLSYKVLNEQSNQLAHYLLENGVKQNSIVPVCVKPGIEMIIAVVAVLKAGCAYLPLEVSIPSERINNIIRDCSADLVLVDAIAEEKYKFSIQTIFLEINSSVCEDKKNINIAKLEEDDLAYVIYTSGSTGTPKGVMLRQIGLLNLAEWTRERYRLNEESNVGQVANFSFDASTWMIWSCLCSGGCLHVADQELRAFPDKLFAWIEEEKLTHCFLPTPLAEAMLSHNEIESSTLKYLLTGGDLLHDIPEKKLPFELTNHYGPTEDTVVTTHALCEPGQTQPPIGYPIANTQIYVLDSMLRQVPEGVAGELYIGGIGISDGYLGQPKLTQEKFIDSPFHPNERLFRTGDLVRYLQDGQLEFIGRNDRQVKIRGYRIELTEVECILSEYTAVQQCVVVANQRGSSHRFLIAYVVCLPDHNADQEILVQFLRNHLPEYMVPSEFIFLNEMPLTDNGKIDLKALPEKNLFNSTSAGASASTVVEKILVRAWSSVLGCKSNKIKMGDDFFDLGGDSISAFQIIVRCERAGVYFTQEKLFQHSTISELSRIAKYKSPSKSLLPTNSSKKKRACLTPIQEWFFSRYADRAERFNQICIVVIDNSVNEEKLMSAIQIVLEHHDIFSVQFVKNGGHYLQQFDGGRNKNELVKKPVSKNVLFSLGNPPLVRYRIETRSSGERILKLTVHHLCIDGVSWRIFLDDIGEAYSNILENKPPELGQVETSYFYWSEKLNEYSRSDIVIKERDYWETQTAKQADKEIIKQMQIDYPENLVCQNTVKSKQAYSQKLSVEKYKLFERKVHRAYNTSPECLLIASLMAALNTELGLYVDIERHGRHEEISGSSLARTIGWFTTVSPMLLEASAADDLPALIKNVKQALKSVPRHGIGYGVLEYLNDRKKALNEHHKPSVSFNFLGKFTSSAFEGVFHFDDTPLYLDQDPLHIRTHVLELDCYVLENNLIIEWGFSNELHTLTTIKRIAEQFESHLSLLVKHCLDDKNFGFVPADFPLLHITQERLDNLIYKVLTAATTHKLRDNLDDIYPLSPLQHGMLFHRLLDPESETYFVQAVFTIEGDMDGRCLKQACDNVVAHYDILRTGFLSKNVETPMQYVLKKSSPLWSELDWEHMSSDAQHDCLHEYLRADRQSPFNLERPPLIRFSLIKLSRHRCQFIVSHHHILLGGWSLFLLINNILAEYESINCNQKSTLSFSPPYKKYIEWLSLQNVKGALDYWFKLLQGFSSPTLLAFQHKQSKVSEETKYEAVTITLPVQLTRKLRYSASKNKITMNTLVQSTWGLLLSYYSAESDVVFGAISASRQRSIADSEKMVGLVLSTLPVRIKVDFQETILGYMQELQKQTIASKKYEHLSLIDIKKCSEIRSHETMFDTLFIYENYPKFTNTQGLVCVTHKQIVEQTNYKLTIYVTNDDALSIRMVYDTAFFDKLNILRIKEHWLQLFLGFRNGFDQRLIMLPSICHSDEKKLRNSKQDVSHTKPQKVNFLERFSAWATAHPNKAAILFYGESLTYSQLSSLTKTIAYNLGKRLTSSNAPIAIEMDRSVEMIACMLAVMSVGCPYLPIDPKYPANRIKFILEDSCAQLLICDSTIPIESCQAVQSKQCRVLDVNCLTVENSQAEALLLSSATPRDIAYILYTSGSTGQPKGVMIENIALINFIDAMQALLDISRDDNFLALTSITFDISVLEILLPLSCGSTINLLGSEAQLDVNLIIEALDRHQISVMQATPATWSLVIDSGWRHDSEMRVICGGEQLNKQLAEKLLADGFPFWHVYGPTETTVWSLAYYVDSLSDTNASVPIGKEIANTEAYVLSSSLKPVPTGVPGELYISGLGVAKGYLNRDVLTRNAFIDSPFRDSTYQRFYKTGDLVRYLPSGDLEFIKRIDGQVKVHGHRIEVAEIECYLLRYQGIKSCVVMAEGEIVDEKHLVAYVVLKSRSLPIAPHDISRFLEYYLPDYMVPRQFYTLKSLPLTSNNKIDRNALRTHRKNLLKEKNGYALPVNDVQRRIVQLWSSALRLEKKQISTQSNFFDLGGDSFSAMYLMSRLEAEFEISMGIKVLFDFPVVDKLAEYIESRRNNALRYSPSDKKLHSNLINNSLIKFKTSGTKTPLFFLHPIGGTVFCYNALINLLSDERPIYAIQDPGIESKSILFSDFSDMAMHYVKLIKSVQAKGPYLLVGASFGANMAIEVARQLEEEHSKVDFIGSIDGWAIYPAKVNNNHEWFARNLRRQHELMCKTFSPDFVIPQHIVELNWNRQQMLARFKHPIWDCNLTLFKSETLLPVLRPIEAKYNHWDRYSTSPVILYTVPGDHESMLMQPHVKSLAKCLNTVLSSLK